MHHWTRGCAAGIVLCGLTLLSLARAQVVTPGGYYGNPYTGRGALPANNPYTGVSQVPAYNPYTGRQAAPVLQANLFTGAAPSAGTAINPYSGRYGSRAENRVPPGSFGRRIPITGKAGPGLEDIDAGVLRILEKHGIPGAALAVAKDGKLRMARGYGWANLQTGEPVRPDAVFAIASLSKTITATAILRLVDQGKLGLDDRALKLLTPLGPYPGAQVDPRWFDITVRQLLNHSGGWNRKISGEPSTFSWRVSRQLRVPLPINADQLIVYMTGEPLDFTPGTEAQYSNFGYIILGQIIEHVTGQPYGEYVRQNVLVPAGMRSAVLSGLDERYPANEVRRYQTGTLQLLAPRILPPLADAAGCWTASSVDLAKFLTALEGSRGEPLLKPATFNEMLSQPPPPLKPRQGGLYCGLGWDAVRQGPGEKPYFKDGLLPGSRTFMGRSSNGVSWVVLFNSGEEMTPLDVVKGLDPKRDLEQHVHKPRDWPDVDLFKEFP